MDELDSLPISELLTEDGVLAIWLTNNTAVHSKLQIVLKKWGLSEITKWHWLKVYSEF